MKSAVATLYAGLVALRGDQGDLDGALNHRPKALQLHECGRADDALATAE